MLTTRYNPVVMRYCEDVTSGRIRCGRYERLAVERHLSDLQTGHLRGLYFDHAAGQKVINFFSRLHNWKGEKARTPIVLQPHQEFYLYVLFGWKRENGTRRFRKSYKEVSRKQGKTTEAAGKAIYLAAFDGEEGAQVYFTATKEAQAKIGFNDAVKIVETSPGLSEFLKPMARSIVAPGSNSFLQFLGSDSKTQDGFDPNGGVIDEYHAHPNSGMLDVIESGMGARRQPLVDIITTAGFNIDGPCYEYRQSCIKILDGVLEDDSTFALLFNLDEGDEYQDEDVWRKVAPNLGVSVYVDYLRDQVRQAQNEGGQKEVSVKTKNFNVWTQSAETWIRAEKWIASGNQLDEEALAGAICWGGLDVANVNDFTAFALMFPTPEGGFDWLSRCWLPEETATEYLKKVAPMARWIDDGAITLTPGNVTDFRQVAREIIDLCNRFAVRRVGADPNYGVELINTLNEEFEDRKDDEGGFVFACPTKMVHLAEPTGVMERLILEKKLNHGRNPVLAWMASNVLIRRHRLDEEMKMPEKSSKNAKIDGIIAGLNALVAWRKFPSPKTAQPQFFFG